MIDIQTEIEPGFDRVMRDLRGAVDDEIDEGMQYIADHAPEEMQLLFGNAPPSKVGESPANRTRALHDSLRGQYFPEEKTVRIEMAEHGFYLDPVFEGMGKGGGYLNRPFFERGLDKAIPKAFDVV